MIKAVIFDYGGVIKQDSHMFIDCAEIYNMPSEEIRELDEKIDPILTELDKGLIDEDDFWKKYSCILGKSEPDNCVKKYREIYQTNLKFHTEFFDLAKDLRNKGIKTAVFSNIFQFQADIIRKNGGYDCFDKLFLSCDKKMVKPDLGFYRLVVKELKIEPEDCLFIDDREINLTPAKSLGMKTVLVKNSEQAIKDVLDIIKSQK